MNDYGNGAAGFMAILCPYKAVFGHGLLLFKALKSDIKFIFLVQNGINIFNGSWRSSIAGNNGNTRVMALVMGRPFMSISEWNCVFCTRASKDEPPLLLSCRVESVYCGIRVYTVQPLWRRQGATVVVAVAMAAAAVVTITEVVVAAVVVVEVIIIRVIVIVILIMRMPHHRLRGYAYALQRSLQRLGKSLFIQ